MKTKYRTKLGIWIAVYCAKHGHSIASFSNELGLSPTTLSLIMAGQHPLPVFLRENIIVTFNLSEDEIKELDRIIIQTENQAIVVTRNYKQYIEAKTENKKEWSRDLMDAAAANVNKLTPEAAHKIMDILHAASKSSEQESAEISKDIDIEDLSEDLFRRYKKDPEKAKQILNYIKEKRG